MGDSTPEQRLVRRVNIIMAGLSAVGGLAAAIYWGVAGVLGFAAGSAVSFLNFRWMAAIVFAVGAVDPATQRPLKPVSALLLGSRYLLFGAIGYVIFVYSETGFLAALAGCCIHIAAVLLEVIYELIYGTS
jgi:hypothetical protein